MILRDGGFMRSGRSPFLFGSFFGAAAMWVAITLAGGPTAGEAAASTYVQGPGGAAKVASKVVLENESVRVKDVTVPPGVLDTGTHTHEYAHVGVILTKGALVFTEPGKAGETVQFEAGSVGFREAKATHQVANPGTAPMRVIEVEIK